MFSGGKCRFLKSSNKSFLSGTGVSMFTRSCRDNQNFMHFLESKPQFVSAISEERLQQRV